MLMKRLLAIAAILIASCQWSEAQVGALAGATGDLSAIGSGARQGRTHIDGSLYGRRVAPNELFSPVPGTYSAAREAFAPWASSRSTGGSFRGLAETQSSSFRTSSSHFGTAAQRLEASSAESSIFRTSNSHFTSSNVGRTAASHFESQSFGRTVASESSHFAPTQTYNGFRGLWAEEARIIGVAERRVAQKEFHSVAYETTLKPSSYPGANRYSHFQEANENLLRAMEADPMFARRMEGLGISISRNSQGKAPGTSPNGWTWHHAAEPGRMQLVPRDQHKFGSAFQDVLHPQGSGGFAKWGK